MEYSFKFLKKKQNKNIILPIFWAYGNRVRLRRKSSSAKNCKNMVENERCSRTNLCQILGALEELQASKLKPFLLKPWNYLSNLEQQNPNIKTQLKQKIPQCSSISSSPLWLQRKLRISSTPISWFSCLIWHYSAQSSSHSRIKTLIAQEQNNERSSTLNRKAWQQPQRKRGKTD